MQRFGVSELFLVMPVVIGGILALLAIATASTYMVKLILYHQTEIIMKITNIDYEQSDDNEDDIIFDKAQVKHYIGLT